MPKFPPILYKYRSFSNNNHRRVLFNQELFLASTSQFNDPFEGSIPLKYKAEDLTPDNIFKKLLFLAKGEHPDWNDTEIHHYCYEDQKKDYLNDEAYQSRENKQLRGDIDKNFGILSLAKDPLNYLMWSHYADSHQGFVIGLDANLLFNNFNGGLGPVTYSNEIPRLDLFGGIDDFIRKLLATKSRVWEYEEEYRLIQPGDARKVIKVDQDCFIELFLGCKMKASEKQEILKFLDNELKHIMVFELELDDQSFRVNKHKIR